MGGSAAMIVAPVRASTVTSSGLATRNGSAGGEPIPVLISNNTASHVRSRSPGSSRARETMPVTRMSATALPATPPIRASGRRSVVRSCIVSAARVIVRQLPVIAVLAPTDFCTARRFL
jgi:hypothetical protein